MSGKVYRLEGVEIDGGWDNRIEHRKLEREAGRLQSKEEAAGGDNTEVLEMEVPSWKGLEMEGLERSNVLEFGGMGPGVGRSDCGGWGSLAGGRGFGDCRHSGRRPFRSLSAQILATDMIIGEVSVKLVLSLSGNLPKLGIAPTESEASDISECRVMSLLFVNLSIFGHWTLFSSYQMLEEIAIELYPPS